MASKGEGSVEAGMCSAAKSEFAVAGGEGLVIRFPTKRKAVIGSGYTEGDQPAEGWIDDYLEGAGEMASFNPLGSERKASEEANLPASAVLVFDVSKAHKEGLPGIDYLADSYTPGEIVERRKKHEEDMALCKKIDDAFEVFQKELRESILKNGCFEVDDDYHKKREEFNAWTKEQWARINKTKLHIFAPGTDKATQGYIEDSESDSELEDDEFLGDGEDAECEDQAKIAM